MSDNILFVHNHLAPFVALDRDLLAENYRVQTWYQRSRVINFPGLVRAVYQSDLVFAWFASWHSVWPVVLAGIFRKPSIVVVGGYDVANRPDINYGLQRGGVKKIASRFVLRSATVLAAISNYSSSEILKNIGPWAVNKTQTIHLGVPDLFSHAPVEPRQSMVLTIGNVNRSNLERKGHESFARASSLIPQLSFILAGAWRDDAIVFLRGLAGSNMTFTGWVEPDILRNYLAQASVYVQASQHEGFGLAVAEAMLAGCIPVVARVGSLPEVVGECGVYLSTASPQSIAEGVQAALALGADARVAARQRILDCFPMSHRREKLRALIESLLSTDAS